MFEKELNDLFTKKVNYKLPESAKKILISAMPWLALIGGLLTLLGAWGIYQAATWTNSLTNVANDLSVAYGYGPTVQRVSSFIWVSFVILLVEAVLMFVAFSPLKQHAKKGWTIMYWLSLVNVAYAVIYIFIDFNFFSLLFSLLGSAIGLYLLFQIRSAYLGGSATPKSSGQASKKS